MRVHFIGIGGIGVSALAQYYLAKGWKVSGSDLENSEITKDLKEKGAKIYIGKHKKENVPKNVDLVVHSPAVRENNPELLKAKKNRIPDSELRIQVKSYPQALGDLTKKYFTIAVSGTHGKSTTAAMLALILIKAGFDPTVIIGTKLKEFRNSNFRMGGLSKPKFKILNSKFPNPDSPSRRDGHILNSKILLIEADEWKASFLNYYPKVIVLTNIEKEHLDYYKDLEHILKIYRKFIGHLSKDGVLAVNRDDDNIKKLLKSSCQNSGVGLKLKIKILKFSFKKQKEAKKIQKMLKIPGEHNVYNGLAALAAARTLKIPDKITFKALAEYKGIWRRFELLKGEIGGKKITIVSDYGHHPTEIKATLKAAREKFPKKRIWCVFQPHQYQRSYYLFNDFVKVFSQSPIDRLIISDIYDVAGRETKEIKAKISSEKIIKQINRPGFIYLAKEKIKNYLEKNLNVGEVLIIMGAGDIYKLIDIFHKKELT